MYETLDDGKTIIYDRLINVSFSHIDSYGHVNSKHYLDYIATARLLFLQEEFNLTVDDILKKGFGFYLVTANQNFIKPIIGLRSVRVISYVVEDRDGILHINYKLTSPDKEKVYSEGKLIYAVIELAKQKKVETPKWLKEVFVKYD